MLTGDSGGNVPPGMSVTKPVAGRVAVARLLAGFMKRGAPLHFERALVGGAPGLLIMADDAVGGGLIGTWSFEVTEAAEPGSDVRLVAIRGVLNPEKLRHLGPLADLSRMREWLTSSRSRTRPAPRARTT
nr:hypothetical protein GCM10025730_05380 [Promicromonospora thailandica]